MAFLHKYLGQGGGSAKTICFCFMCSSKCHFRHRGYPGGCMKCRSLQCVYDEVTGVQNASTTMYVRQSFYYGKKTDLKIWVQGLLIRFRCQRFLLGSQFQHYDSTRV
jgi:hypothetical protein